MRLGCAAVVALGLLLLWPSRGVHGAVRVTYAVPEAHGSVSSVEIYDPRIGFHRPIVVIDTGNGVPVELAFEPGQDLMVRLNLSAGVYIPGRSVSMAGSSGTAGRGRCAETDDIRGRCGRSASEPSGVD